MNEEGIEWNDNKTTRQLLKNISKPVKLSVFPFMGYCLKNHGPPIEGVQIFVIFYILENPAGNTKGPVNSDFLHRFSIVTPMEL